MQVGFSFYTQAASKEKAGKYKQRAQVSEAPAPLLYFHIETICAYINQLHGKSKENIVSFKDKKISERIKLLLDEFMQYIKNPIKIIK